MKAALFNIEGINELYSLSDITANDYFFYVPNKWLLTDFYLKVSSFSSKGFPSNAGLELPSSNYFSIFWLPLFAGVNSESLFVFFRKEN